MNGHIEKYVLCRIMNLEWSVMIESILSRGAKVSYSTIQVCVHIFESVSFPLILSFPVFTS